MTYGTVHDEEFKKNYGKPFVVGDVSADGKFAIWDYSNIGYGSVFYGYSERDCDDPLVLKKGIPSATTRPEAVIRFDTEEDAREFINRRIEFEEMEDVVEGEHFDETGGATYPSMRTASPILVLMQEESASRI